MKERNSNTHNIIIILVFVCFLGFFGIAYIVVPDREYSELENRYLTTFPELTAERLFNGEFMSDFDSYTADQIYGKDLFVKGNVAYNRMLGIKEINQVFIGKENYLIQDYQEPGDLLDENLASIEEFAEAHPELPIAVLLAPNANEIYPEMLPSFVKTYPQSRVMVRANAVLSADNLTFVDATGALAAKKDENMYYKTDHHWTTDGAYSAYQELCGAIGLTPKKLEEYERIEIQTPFYGSLYSKAPVTGNPGDHMTLYRSPDEGYRVTYVMEDRTEDSLYDESYLTKKDQYAVFFGGNYAYVKIENEKLQSANIVDSEITGVKTGNVLVIKDSYANALIPFLADQYADIHMLDLRYYHDDISKLIEENEIGQVIFIHNVDFLSTDNSFVWLN